LHDVLLSRSGRHGVVGSAAVPADSEEAVEDPVAVAGVAETDRDQAVDPGPDLVGPFRTTAS